jgi:RNA polymerase sigma-70 factor (ECF subfamily)
MDLNDKDLIYPLLEKCREGQRRAQRELFTLLYPYGMSICLRYSDDENQAKDVLSVSFLKIFNKLSQHSPDQSFKAWVRRIFINTAIDFYRKQIHSQNHLDLSAAERKGIEPTVIMELSAEVILEMVTKLPPAYRTVFNLYAIEGYSHKEIAERLSINEGTSKSNLSKARQKLRSMLAAIGEYGMKSYG